VRDVSHPRRTFVVRVRATDRSVVLEDVQTGERIRLPGVPGIEDRIQTWLDATPAPALSNVREEGTP
jgi:hypothetical protein